MAISSLSTSQCVFSFNKKRKAYITHAFLHQSFDPVHRILTCPNDGSKKPAARRATSIFGAIVDVLGDSHVLMCSCIALQTGNHLKDNFGCDNLLELGMSDKSHSTVMGSKKALVMVSRPVKKIFDLLNDVGVLLLYFDGLASEVTFVDLAVVFVAPILDPAHSSFIVHHMNTWNNVMC